ncbi:MAG: hypothetical protein ACLQVD_17490 [Capsulimonadaceae bacterium]
MDVKVKVRLNRITGEVEVFDVIDEGGERLPEAEHNRLHDRITADVGRVFERNPEVLEVLPGSELYDDAGCADGETQQGAAGAERERTAG